MEGRKWEELNMDCLVNVLGRVGIESLLLDIPFVCKSWFKATLSSLCWRRLNFSEDSTARLIYKYEVKFCSISMMKFVVNRSDRCATYLSLPNRSLTDEALIYVADGCPNLRTFVLPYGLPYEHMLKIPNLINKWKSLEYLTLGASCFQLQDIIYQISIHCNNFVGLGVPSAYIGKSDASAIATLLPNIKELDLRCANIEKEYLVMILKGCKELEYVDVSYCEGFDEGDIDILKLASHIHTFKPEGSMFYSDYDEEWDDNDDFDLDEMYYWGYRSC
ncbi:F-box/LRR-repeat protein [Camellia lanceoleosa]|nr:F-box/LRR-repeat protein [Camellia lanceoleosa]